MYIAYVSLGTYFFVIIDYLDVSFQCEMYQNVILLFRLQILVSLEIISLVSKIRIN